MPQMANITIKKNDGTTDVTYSQVVPSAGDKSPAIWKNLSVGTAASHRPELKLSSRDNGTNSARRLESTFSYPTLTTGNDGKVNVADKAIFNITGVIPKGMPDADVNEAVSQCFNAHAATLLKDCYKSGYAAT